MRLQYTVLSLDRSRKGAYEGPNNLDFFAKDAEYTNFATFFLHIETRGKGLLLLRFRITNDDIDNQLLLYVVIPGTGEQKAMIKVRLS